jgi:hypothetical protein
MIHMNDGVLIWTQEFASMAVNLGITETGLRKSNRSIVARLHLVEELLKSCIISISKPSKVVKSKQFVFLVASHPL